MKQKLATFGLLCLAVIAIAPAASLGNPVHAQGTPRQGSIDQETQTAGGGEGDVNLCSVFPFLESFPAICSGEEATAVNFVRDRLNLILSLVFITILVISVWVIVRAGLKYIQSQGEEGKIEEAQKAIRSVFLGIAALFVGVIGIVLVLAFFGGTGLLNTSTTDGDEGCYIDSNGEFICERDSAN